MRSGSSAVGIITFKRPDGLLRLLSSIEERLVDHAEVPVTQLIIVDNDPEMSAELTVAAFAEQSQWPIRYVSEPTPGIAAARNRVVAEAAGAKYLAIVDDDEVIERDWPAGLIGVAERYQADMVGGPVEADLSAGPFREWMKRPDMFGRPEYSDGQAVAHVSTANCLIRMDLRERLGHELFDVRLGLSGGSDWFLSEQIRGAGGSLRYSASATTREFFPSDRVSLRWLSRRWRRSAATSVVLLRLSEASTLRSTATLFVRRCCLKVVAGTGMILASPLTKPSMLRRWQGVRQIMLALGTLEGLFGRVPVSYGAEGFETND